MISEARHLKFFSLKTRIVFVSLLGILFSSPGQGEDYVRRFDGAQPSWKIHQDRTRSRLIFQKMDRDARVNGWESIRFEILRNSTTVDLEQTVPAAHVIDELQVSLWMRANRANLKVALRIRLPDQRNPQTGEILSFDIPGEEYTKPGNWQKLVCKVDRKKIQSQIRRLRARLNNPEISERGMYLGAISVNGEFQPGIVEFNIHSFQVSPLIRMNRPIANGRNPILQQASATRKSQRFQLPVEFRLDRLRVNGYPFFPRMAAYHNESLDAMKSSGMNVVWVPDLNNHQLMENLRVRGMWVTASPPRTINRGEQAASLLPVSRYGVETAPILFWNIGTRIPPSAKKDVVRWLDDIRRADAGVERPIMGDVLGLERIYSRHLPLLGVSRHILNTSLGFKQYRDWLIQKQKLARPGNFTWTWIQTEPSSHHVLSRKRAGENPIVIEPEQIRLQVYSALAAGCLGIGYWKSSRLDGDLPGSKERMLAISQLNLELELLGPWLATGTVVSQTRFSVEAPPADQISQRRLDFRSTAAERAQRQALLRARAEQIKRNAERASELEAAVIRSEYGMLLLPIWYQTDAQYVPGKMTARNANIIVHGVAESALAWEVTTTGIRSLVRKRVTGGLQITIPQFDQTTAVILTSNRALIEQLRKKIAERNGNGMAAKSARLSVDLAREKLSRIQRINEELTRLNIRQPDAPQLLAKAAFYVQQAETARKRGLYHSARLSSGVAMQHLRILQRAHWSHAVQNLYSPVSSPHTVCFQSLPDHWRLVTKLGRVQNHSIANLLRSGDFEDFDTLVAEKWQHRQNKTEGIRATAELYPAGHKSSYALRLVAASQPGTTPPATIAKPPVTVTTPSMTVRSGQIVQITGWVRVISNVTGSLDGGMVYDSLAGPGGAIRFGTQAGWRRFSLIRPVQSSGQFSITFSLTGMGDLLFDDIQVVVHSPSSLQPDSKNPTTPKPEETPSPLRFLNRLPKIPSIPGFRNRQ
ncbi:MAG: hypothetical protein Tsb009_26150 [Planctomycetaceae bacterium]